MKSRRGFAIQRLMNAMRQAHADGWFIVFDTLTLADDRLEAFYDNPNALRDYFRDIGRMVLAAEGRKANDSHAANQVVSVGADIAFDADPKFFACLVRFESSSVPTTLPTAYDVYPLDGRHDGGYYTVKDCVTIDVLPRTPG